MVETCTKADSPAPPYFCKVLCWCCLLFSIYSQGNTAHLDDSDLPPQLFHVHQSELSSAEQLIFLSQMSLKQKIENFFLRFSTLCCWVGQLCSFCSRVTFHFYTSSIIARKCNTAVGKKVTCTGDKANTDSSLWAAGNPTS